jgi:hypothetical protein
MPIYEADKVNTAGLFNDIDLGLDDDDLNVLFCYFVYDYSGL